MGGTSHPADSIELHDPHGLLADGDAAQVDDAQSRIDGGPEWSNSLAAPPHAVSALPTWNQNKANVFKTLSTFVSFLIMGANDAAYGVSRERWLSGAS